MISETIIKNLRKIMADKSLTQATMARYADTSASQFSKILNGTVQLLRGTFDIELIYSKCEHLSGDWLLSGEGDMLRSTNEAIANGDNSVAVNNNYGNIYTSENDALKERISLLERIIEEKERLIRVLMEK